MLYTKNGSYPAAIPFRIKLSDGRTRTDPTSFTPEEIADAGYIAVDDPPTVTGIQVLEWSGTEWIVRDKTEEELAVEEAAKKEDLSRQINEYRDTLIADGFWFNENKFDSKSEDQKRISGAALLAFIAISNGAQANNLYWHGGTTPFEWIDQRNNIIQMDAQTVVELGKVAAEHERSHIFYARALKDMNPIPENFKDPSYWGIVET